MSRKLISGGLWFDSNAEEAVQFYMSVFPGSGVHRVAYYGKEGFEIHRRPEGSVMSVHFTLCGEDFHAVNGGPVFSKNPSISYFIMCSDAAEADTFWNALISEGQELMPLGSYDWSPRYGWLTDKYGVSWQIYTGQPNDEHQKICPSLLFTGSRHGKAEAAVRFYTSVFNNSDIQGILKHPPGGPEPEGTVMHAQFKLGGYVMMAMDSAQEHGFTFNEGISFVVSCKTQEEIDYYWEKLLGNGGEASACGWLKDQFGVSWQVIPDKLGELLADPDKAKAARAARAMMQMEKIDLGKLIREAESQMPGF